MEFIIDEDYFSLNTMVRNPINDDDRTPQEICIPVQISNVLNVQVKHQFTGQGDMRFDGSVLSYCPCDTDDPDVNSLACNCLGEIISTGGEYISDIGVNNGSDADGLPDNDFTNNVSGNDVLTLGFDLGPDDVFGEICVVVGFNNRRGAVSFTYNNDETEIENPTGLTGLSLIHI